MSRGSVLIVALWASAFLASMAAAHAARVGLQARLIGRERELAEASQAVRSGFAYGLWQLEADPDRGWDARVEEWAHPERWMPKVAEGQEVRWTVTVSDAEGTVNLNAARPEQLARIPALAALGTLIEQHRAERPFAHLEELVTRVGLPRAAVADLRPIARVSGSATVNLNAATPTVLEILGLPATVAAQVCQVRDGHEGSDDDLVFRSPDPAAIHDLLVGRGLGETETALVTALVSQGMLDVKSSSYQIDVAGVSSRHGMRRACSAVIVRSAPGTRAKVARWDET